MRKLDGRHVSWGVSGSGGSACAPRFSQNLEDGREGYTKPVWQEASAPLDVTPARVLKA